MPPVERLCVIYDGACGLCTNVKAWIKNQAPLVDLEWVASGSPEARRRFPQLPAGELAVVGNTGEVWLGDRAWIVCLWALRDYREWSIRLSGPFLLPLARQAFAALSTHRASLSSLLHLQSEQELEHQLRKIVVPRCATRPS